MPNIIEISELHKTFSSKGFLSKKGKSIPVLSNINLQIQENECFCILGPNMAGKTTLIKILSSLVLADKGEIKIAGFSLKKDAQRIKSKIGLITSQERSFYWRLTGRQNLEFFASIYGLNSKYIKIRIKELTSYFRVNDILDNTFQKYSSGAKQKFSLIRGLLHDPEILLMDEPTKSLDPNAAKEMREFIKNELLLKQKKTIIFSTHYIHEAEFLSSRIAILDKGIIKSLGKKEDIIKQAYPTCDNLADAFSKITE